MNSQTENRSTPSKRRPSLFKVAGVLITVLLLGVLLPYLWNPDSVATRDFRDVLQALIFVAGVIGLLLLGFAYVFPRLFNRAFRRELLQGYLFSLVSLVTLAAAFYAVENWRGKRAWMACKQELEAKGVVLDWTAYVPPPVPDEQNIYKAPRMTEWFARDRNIRKTMDEGLFSGLSVNDLLEEQRTVALITLVPTGGKVSTNEVRTSFVYSKGTSLTPDSRVSLRKMLETSSGERQRTDAVSLTAAQNFTLATKRHQGPAPLEMIIQADKDLDAREIQQFLFSARSDFVVKAAGTNTYRILGPNDYATIAAEDYLEWTDRFEAEFTQIREALRLPYARIDDDYRHPLMDPFPNFVSVRIMAHTLSQRAQCYLLLNEPDEALRELTFLHDLRRLLHPSGQKMKVVTAMIDVAVAGLHTSVISDGFRLGVWKDPQIAVIQEQLKDTRLLERLITGIQSERADVIYLLINTTGNELEEIFFLNPSVQKSTLWQKLRNSAWLSFELGPRGWIYQNATTIALLFQEQIECVDGTNPTFVTPGKVQATADSLIASLKNGTPYNSLARIVVPNLPRTFETAVRNETTASQGIIACALERYRLQHNQYPETLQALSPDYLETIPHDPIGGQPMKYNRTSNGSFLLYSIGWDEKDDGGKPAEARGKSGDWVWNGSPETK